MLSASVTLKYVQRLQGLPTDPPLPYWKKLHFKSGRFGIVILDPLDPYWVWRISTDTQDGHRLLVEINKRAYRPLIPFIDTTSVIEWDSKYMAYRMERLIPLAPDHQIRQLTPEDYDDVNDGCWTLPVETTTMRVLRKAVVNYLKILPGPVSPDLDLCGGNIMLRSNGTLVASDPFGWGNSSYDNSWGFAFEPAQEWRDTQKEWLIPDGKPRNSQIYKTTMYKHKWSF